MEGIGSTPPRGIAIVDWGVATRAMPGEATTGDVHLALRTRQGLLFAAIDGLGHGLEAAEVADRARATLVAYADEPVISQLRRCHSALRSTRGAVMSLAAVDEHEALLTWIGVGNVEGVIQRAAPESGSGVTHLLLRAGVVGSALPELRAEVVTVARGDLLVLATDGVDSAFSDDLPRGQLAAQELADRLLQRFAKPTDDALVLVARCTSGR